MIFSYVLPQTSLPGIFSFTCFTSSKTLKSFVFLQILEYFLFIFRSQDLQNFWIVVYKLVANPNISVGDVVFPTPPTPWNGLSPGGSTVLWNKNKKQYRVKVSPNIKQYILFEVILNMKIWFWKVYLKNKTFFILKKLVYQAGAELYQAQVKLGLATICLENWGRLPFS